MLQVIHPHIVSIEWGVEAFVTGDAEMLVDALLMLNGFDNGGPTATSHAQAKGFIDELLALPDEQDWAGQFKAHRPRWARVLERPEG
jgi:alpha-galactosidase/6-phospho-beta-glucosidase family protein